MVKKDWSTPGARLRWAIDVRPAVGRQRGVRKFAADIARRSQELERAGSRPIPGISLPSITSYLPTGDHPEAAEPKLAFFREAAALCGVNEGWLMTGDGYPTPELADAAAAGGGGLRIDDPLTKSASMMMYTVLTQLGIPHESRYDPNHWQYGNAFPSFWAAPLAELRTRLHTGTPVLTRDPLGFKEWPLPADNFALASLIDRDIARALRGPLEAFRVDPNKMDKSALGDFIMAMMPALLAIATERDRQHAETREYWKSEDLPKMVEVTPEMHRKQELAKSKRVGRRNVSEKSPTRTKKPREK